MNATGWIHLALAFVTVLAGGTSAAGTADKHALAILALGRHVTVPIISTANLMIRYTDVLLANIAWLTGTRFFTDKLDAFIFCLYLAVNYPSFNVNFCTIINFFAGNVWHALEIFALILFWTVREFPTFWLDAKPSVKIADKVVFPAVVVAVAGDPTGSMPARVVGEGTVAVADASFLWFAHIVFTNLCLPTVSV